MNSSCSCVLPCDEGDAPASAEPERAGACGDQAKEGPQDETRPGPFGRWALFLAGTRRAREEPAGEAPGSDA